MRAIGLGIVATACCLAAAPDAASAQSEPAAPRSINDRYPGQSLILEPTTDWQVQDYSDRCRLSRDFGPFDQSVTLRIEQGSDEPSFNLTLIGWPVRALYGSQVRVQFEPEPSSTRGYVKSGSSMGRPVLSLFGIQLPGDEEQSPASDQEPAAGADEEESIDLTRARLSSARADKISNDRLNAITGLHVSGAALRPFKLETGALEAPVEQLEQCAASLDKRLSDNTQEAKEAGVPVIPVELERWARIIQENYPAPLLRQSIEGRVGVKMTINKEGRPTFCTITGNSGSPSFNDTVCLLMLQHSKFEPARDAENDPIPAYFETRITFRLN